MHRVKRRKRNMRNKKAIVAVIAIAVLALGGALASFANENQEDTTAVVVFQEPNWDDFEVTRPGPEHDNRTPLNRGPFVLAWVPTFDFGIHVVGTGPVFNVRPENYDGLHAGTGSDGNHFVNVWDYRNFSADASVSNGWNVTVQQTSNFTYGAMTLSNTQMTFSGDVSPGRVTGFNPDGTMMTGGVLATANPIGVLFHSVPDGVTGSASPILPVATAADGQGAGSTAINLGQGNNITLSVPIVDQRVGEFTANLRWVLQAGTPTGP
jgi:hypothetical protein